MNWGMHKHDSNANLFYATNSKPCDWNAFIFKTYNSN